MPAGAFPQAPHWNGPFYRPVWIGQRETITPGIHQDFVWNAMDAAGAWYYTIKGCAELVTSNQRIPIKSRDILAVETPCRARLCISSKQPYWNFIVIVVRSQPALDTFRTIQKHTGLVHSAAQNSLVLKTANQLVTLATAQPERTPHFWSQHIFEWLQHWRASILPVIPCNDSSRFKQPPLITPLQCNNFKNYARRLGYNASYLNEKLKRRWGKLPGRTLRTSRLQEAMRLLHESNESIEDIARKIGYSDGSSLRKALRKETNLSPLEFRRTKAS